MSGAKIIGKYVIPPGPEWVHDWEPVPEAFKDRFIQGYARGNGQFMRNFYWCQPALNFGFANPKRPWQLPLDHPDVLALRDELKDIHGFYPSTELCDI